MTILLEHWAPHYAPRFLALLFNRWGGFIPSLWHGWPAWTAVHPRREAFLLGCGWSFLPALGFSTVLHEYLGLWHDPDVILPIPEPRPFDPLYGSFKGLKEDKDEKALPWLKPTAGPRQAAWNELHAFVNHAASDGRWSFFSPPKHATPHGEFRPFLRAVLAGRSGSGKTRMAVEFLRESLGRTTELTQPKRNGSRWKQRRHRLRVACGEWWRRAMPWLRRKNTDPWDIGWLKPEGKTYNTREWNPMVLDHLRRWRPRRPTAFLLDDPVGESVLKIVEAFQARMAKYRYPVRLLIVNQSLQANLKFQPDGPFVHAEDVTVYKTAHGDPYIEVGGNAHLVPAEVTAMATEYLPLNVRHRLESSVPSLQDELARLYKITEGNPMLVELGLRHLRRLESLSTEDAPSLIRDRAQRIYNALRDVHRFKPAQWALLAQTTLAAYTASERHSLEPPDSNTEAWAEYTKHRDDLTGLRLLLNLQDTDSLPSVRPEHVGDAFVRHVLDVQTAYATTWETTPDMLEEREAARRTKQDRWVQAAWPLHWHGVLASAERVAAQTDDLGRAIRLTPPANLPVDPLLLAKAYARAAIQHTFEQTPPNDGGHAVLQTALTHIRNLQPAEVLRKVAREGDLLTCLCDWMLLEDHFSMVRLGAGIVCYLEALGRVLEDETLLPSTEQEMVELLHRVLRALEISRYEYRLPALYDGYGHYVRCVAVLEKLVGYAGTFVPAKDKAITLSVAKVWNHVCRLHAMNQDTDACLNAREQVEALSMPFREDSLFALQLATASQHLCFLYANAGKEDLCTEARDKVIELAGTYSTEKDFALQIASAWRQVCFLYADTEDESYCLKAKNQVIEYASTYSGERDFSLQIANAWKSVCVHYLLWSKETDCLKASNEVGRYAHTYCTDRDFALVLARTSQNVCNLYAKTRNELDCIKARDKVIECAGMHSKERDFALELARAAQHVCFLYANTGNERLCLKAHDKALEHAGKYNAQDNFALVLVNAAQHVCFLYAKAGNERFCLKARDRVLEYAGKYSAQKHFALMLAITWRHLCGLYANTGNIDLCTEARDKVLEIATPYLTDPQFVSELAEADRLLNHVRGTGSGNG